MKRGRMEAFGASLRQLTRRIPGAWDGCRPDALKQDLIASARSSLLIVMAAVVLVLLIGCANIANLQLARAAARERDVALRRALGASPARIVREQLVESLLLALAGGALGWLLTLWLLDLVLQLAPSTLPRRTEVGLNWTVVLFSAGASLFTGLLFGLAPAVHAARSGIQTALVGGGRTSGSRDRTRARRVLIVAEFAIAVVLLVGGALLVRSFWALQQVNPGFDSRGVTVARIWLPQPNDPSTGPYFTQGARALFCRNLLNRLRADVGQVGIATGLPLDVRAQQLHRRRLAAGLDRGRHGTRGSWAATTSRRSASLVRVARSTSATTRRIRARS